jgi:uncharacterized protein YjbI with pentapeptide repeats
MANQEHYNLLTAAANQELKQQGAGRELWNNWRIANPEVIPDLSDVVCPVTSQGTSRGSGLYSVGSGIKLVGFDFSRTNLSNSWFSWANFEGASFSQADLANATLCGGNLSRANLQGANLKKANLNEANLGGADLSNADLKEAELAKANFKGAVLRGANLSGAILNRSVFSRPNYAKIYDTELSEAYNRASLRGANLRGADLIEANLSGADLIEADLSEADLSEADLRDADLSEAKLIKTQLWGADLRSACLIRTDLTGANLGGAKLSAAHFIATILIETDLTMTEAVDTSFKQAILTGACIEDWNISSHTKLDEVICDYVYLKRCRKERRPHNGNFAPGEFTKLFQEIDNTIDLIFRNGINWKAFALAFNQVNARILDTNDEGEIFLREYKVLGDGLIALKVTTPPGSDKTKLRDELMIAYNKIASLEGELKVKNEMLAPAYERLFLPSTQINQSTLNIQNIQNVEGNTNLVSEANKQYTFHAPVGSVENKGHIASSGNQNNIGNVAGEAKAEMKSIQHIHNYAPEQKQTLAEAAAEIQNLLKQLEQTNPTATEAQQIEHINDETTPKFKKRVVGALQATGEAAIDEFVLENKYLKVAKAAIKGWIKSE